MDIFTGPGTKSTMTNMAEPPANQIREDGAADADEKVSAPSSMLQKQQTFEDGTAGEKS